MAVPAIVESDEVSSQPLATSAIDEWDFEALLKQGIAAYDTSIGTEAGSTEPGVSMADEDRISEFDEATERGREGMRSTSVVRVDDDSYMHHKSPVAPESSPLSVAAANDQDVGEPKDTEKIALDTAPEDNQVPMTVEEHYPPAIGMQGQVSDQEESTPVDAGGQATAAKSSQTMHGMNAAAGRVPGEGGVSSPLSPPDSDAHQETPQPKLIDEIIKAVARAERKQFKNGDVAIIVDSADLCKALLIPSDRLKLASSILTVISLDEKPDCKATSVVSQVFVLEPADPTPLLRALDPGVSLAEFQAERVPSDAAPATDQSEKVKIKKEEGIERVEQPIELPASWFATYMTLFEVIDASRLGASKRQLFSTNATEAHPHFVAVMAIAKHYSALPALDLALLRSMSTWIRNGSLYAAIKDDPVCWLEVAITMKNTDIFNEAFVHCAGALVGCPHALETLHPDVTATMERKAAELTERRKEVDPRLSNLMLTTEVPLGAGYRAKAYVSIKNDPVAWIVNQLFADWMREHISYLNGLDEEAAQDGGEFEPETLVNVKTMATCDHKGKQCLNVGGFYRLLGKADDSYLPVSKVLELLVDWNKKFSCDAVKAGVRDALQQLKTMAKAIVGSLADSNLTYAGVDELGYLTCVEVKEGEVPWEDEDVKMED